MVPRRLFALALAAAVAATARAGGAPADGAFLSAIADLPLMPALEERRESGLVFDTPAGRIVEAYATGPVERVQVLTFYAETLPQLGWTPAGEARFRREGEVLTLEFPAAEAGAIGLTIRFSLAPEAAGSGNN